MRWSMMMVWLGGCIVPPPDFGGTPSDDTDPGQGETDDTTPTTTGIRVLVLDDGRAAQQVGPALEAAGHEIVDTKRYTQWNGTNPDLDDVDVVVFLQGSTWEDGLPGVGDDTLVQHVLDGGGIVRTEFAAKATTVAPALVIDLGLPVTYDNGAIEGTQWQVLQRNSPLAEGLATAWDEDGTSSDVVAKAGAEVVIATQDRTPLVTWVANNGGRVVHINHDMTASSNTLTSNMEQLLVNAVTFAADK